MTITFRRILALLANYGQIVAYAAALTGITLAVAAVRDVQSWTAGLPSPPSPMLRKPR